MNKGFTTKELLIAILIIGLTILVISPIITNNMHSMQQEELLSQSKIYIESLNSNIINAKKINKQFYIKPTYQQ